MRNLILGTDWWTDCDDVVALRILARAHKSGDICIKGIGINGCMEFSVASLDGFLKTEGVRGIPIGIDVDATDFGGNPPYQKRLSAFASEYFSNDDAEDAVRLYRRILAESEEKIEIIEIGFLQVFANVLESKPDDISEKTGIELVSEKVSKVWIMAGKWDEENGEENNFIRNERSRAAGNVLCEKCPVPVTFLGWEIGADVIRPSIAGLMGAYGAALHAMRFEQSTILKPRELINFSHTSQTTRCKGCANQCHLTINRFADGKRFISGNQCEKGLGVDSAENIPNLHAWKRAYLESLGPKQNKRGTIGIPMALSTFELAPIWYTLFSELGFAVQFSKLSNRATYERGQFTIPSDTACYPAKIMHGHILQLIDDGIENIFYPGITYNINENAGDNHYNCPIVAYYSELLRGNIEELKQINFMYPYLDINSEDALTKTIAPCLEKIDRSISRREIKNAVKKAFAAYEQYKADLRAEGEKAVNFARENGYRIMILAGRPYHIDPEIGHGIDKLATSLGFVVVSEDSICHLAPVQYVNVLDQWTFHARLYRSARYAVEHSDTELVQLVSFGCGVDAITTDEVRSILENGGKYYTQIKIDEITNLGAVKIRLRSLLGALDERR